LEDAIDDDESAASSALADDDDDEEDLRAARTSLEEETRPAARQGWKPYAQEATSRARIAKMVNRRAAELIVLYVNA
jgi:hypothetical protein